MTKVDYLTPHRISTERQCQALDNGVRCNHKARWRVIYDGNELQHYLDNDAEVLSVTVELCDQHKKAVEPWYIY